MHREAGSSNNVFSTPQYAGYSAKVADKIQNSVIVYTRKQTLYTRFCAVIICFFVLEMIGRGMYAMRSGSLILCARDDSPLYVRDVHVTWFNKFDLSARAFRHFSVKVGYCGNPGILLFCPLRACLCFVPAFFCRSSRKQRNSWFYAVMRKFWVWFAGTRNWLVMPKREPNLQEGASPSKKARRHIY